MPFLRGNLMLELLQRLKKVDEFVLADLKKEIDGKSRPHNGTSSRAKDLKSFYQKTTKRGYIYFKSTAATTPGRDFWNQKIRLVDWDVVLGLPDKSLSSRDRAHMAIFGDLAVHCDCPAFLYWGYAFITTQLDMNAGKAKEKRPPNIRNPKREGIGCKHIASVLGVLPFHISEVARVIKKIT